MLIAFFTQIEAPCFICTPAVLSHWALTLHSKIAGHGLPTAGRGEALHQSAVLLVVLIQLAFADHWGRLDDALAQMVIFPQDLLFSKGGVFGSAESTLAGPFKASVLLYGIGWVFGGGELAVVCFAGSDAFEDVEMLNISAIALPLIFSLHFEYTINRTINHRIIAK